MKKNDNKTYKHWAKLINSIEMEIITLELLDTRGLVTFDIL